MNLKKIYTEKAPEPVGPYSQAVVSGNLIFCSGQIGLDPRNGVLLEGIEAQTKQALENLRAVLNMAGVSPEQVIKTTIYFCHAGNFPVINEVYRKFFGEHKPARSTVEVLGLPKGALVEVEAVAITRE
jgi:2-iminobutanoate/2-iminopropanoate deaminase